MIDQIKPGDKNGLVITFALFQVTNHFTDFETDPEMMECLEKFEDILEKESSSSQQMLRMLLFASQTKVLQKISPSIKIIIDNKY